MYMYLFSIYIYIQPYPYPHPYPNRPAFTNRICRSTPPRGTSSCTQTMWG